MEPALDPRRAVYVGSFDPLTLGHQDLIVRGSRLFEHLTVGIGINPDKAPLFTSEERLAMTRRVVDPLPNVEVRCFEGLAVEFTRDAGAGVLLRGLRTLTDVDAEFTMTLANRALDPEIETVFLMASERFSHISSTLIKQIAKMGTAGAGSQLREFVPEDVVEPLIAKFHRA
jgi:pantetheine-phosphate adenylyltransferase